MRNIENYNNKKMVSELKLFKIFKVFLLLIIPLLISVDSFSQLTATFTNRKDACDASNNGSIDITITGSVGTIDLDILGPPNFVGLTPTDGIAETVSGMTARTYFVVVQDDVDTKIYNIEIFNITPDLSAALNLAVDNTDCAIPNGSIDIDVAGGTGAYSYAWTGPNGFTSALEDISGLEGGDYFVDVFDDGTNCFRSLGAITLTNPIIDASLTVTPAADPICETTSTTIDVDLTEVGVSYQLRNDVGDVDVGGPVIGTGATINLATGALTTTTTFNVFASYGVCTSVELTTLATVNVNAAPNTGLTVTPAADPICETTSTTIDVDLSELGYSYQLRNDAGDLDVGAPIIGTGGTINLPTGVLAATTTFNVLVTNGTCTVELATLATVNVVNFPNAGLAVTAAADPICETGSTTIDIALSEVGYTYQLRNDVGDVNIGAPVAGTGGTINLSTGALSTTTTFNVLATNGVCTPVELTTLVTVNVDAAPNTGLTVTAAADPICETGSTTIDVDLSEVGYSYQLRNDVGDVNVGAPIVGTGATINLPTGALLVTSTFNVLVTNGTCSEELVTLVTVNVDAAPNLGLTVIPAADPICETGSTTIDVALSEVGYSYQLRNDAGDVNVGAPIIGTGATISLPTGALTTTTTFNVFVNNGTCSIELTTLATVNVDAAPNTGLTVTPAADPICETTSTTIDVDLSEVGYSYQLRNDVGDVNVGAPIIGTGGTINLPTGVLVATTTFNVLVTNGTCIAELSTLATVNIVNSPNAGLVVTAATDPICETGSTSIDVALSEIGYTYQLRNDVGDVNIGSPVAGTGGTINLPTGALTTTTTFNVLATNGVCTPVELTTLVTVTVDAAPNTGLTVTPAADPICETGSTTIDVDLSEVGVSYQLRNDVGDVNVGTPVVGTGGTINLPTGALAATTTFNVFVTNGTCSIELIALATVNVDAGPNTGLVVTPVADPICETGSTTIDVDLSEVGVSYQLRNDVGDVNIGAPIVGTGGTISLPTGALTITTTFNVLATIGACPPIELTTLVTVNVDAGPNTGLTVTPAADPICETGSTTIDVDLSEVGYSYQLRNDAGDVDVGAPVIGTGGTISLPTGALTTTTTFNILVNNGTCSIELTTLATVNVNAAPNTGLTVTPAADPICETTSTTIDIDLSEVGYSYQLRNDVGDVDVGAPVIGTGGTINLSTGVLATTTTFNVLVDNGSCSIELATLATVNVVVSPNAALVVTAAADPICETGSTTIDVALSEVGYTYQLRNDIGDVNIGSPVAGTGATINLPTGALTTTTTFNVLASNGICADVELTTLVTVNVDAAPNTGLTVTPAADPICETSSTTIDIDLSEVGVSYQLRNDVGDVDEGAPVAGTGGTISLPTGALTSTTTFNILATRGTCSLELVALATVNVDPAPDVTISGPNAVCDNDVDVYSVPNAGVGATYTWTVNNEVSFTDGGVNDNFVTVTWGLVDGDVSVSILAPNTCSATSVVFAVAVSAISPPPNGDVDIAESYCQNGALPTLDANTAVGASVKWYSDAALTNEIGNVNPFTPLAADLDMSSLATTTFYVTQDVGCGVDPDPATASIEYAITVVANPDGTITGNNSICANTSGEVYSVPAGATTYAWSLTGGDGIIVSGAATNSVTVDWLTTGGDLQVTVTGAVPASCVVVSTMTVTVGSAITPQTINESDHTICENATASISLGNSEIGVDYELLLNGTPTGVTNTGDGTSNFLVGVLGFADGLIAVGSPHTIGVQATVGGGCLTVFPTSIDITVTPGVQDQTIVEAGAQTACLAVGQIVSLASSENSVTYEILLNGNSFAPAKTKIGDGNALVLGNILASDGLTIGAHTITVTATLASCTITLTDQIDVTVQDIPNPPTGSTTVAACLNGPPPTLQVTSDAGSTVNWYDPLGITIIGTGDIIDLSTVSGIGGMIDMTQTGTTIFFATQETICGESNRLNISVVVESCSGCYTVDIETTAASCTNDDGSITLRVGAAGVSPFDYEITETATGLTKTQDNQPNNSFTISGEASGNYTYLVRDATACEVTGSVDIGLENTKVTAVVEKAGDIACFGDPTGGTARITVTGGLAPEYQYKHPGVADWTDFTSGEVISGLPVGEDYSIQVRDDINDGCPFIETISITEPSAIEATANKLTDTYPEQNVGSFEVVDMSSDFPPFDIMLLDGNGDVIDDFTPVEVNRFGDYEFIFEQLAIGSYVAVVRDDTGCEITLDQITIGAESNIAIPNVFTPNNDGINEAFIILNKQPDTKIVIANRWGVQVFASDDYQNDWRGEGVPDAVYFYTIAMGGEVYKGSVEVWRGGAKINN